MLRAPAAIAQGILARAALALLRIYLGAVFLLAGWPKVRGEFAVTLENGHPFYRQFVQQVVLPNASLFAALLSWGELLVGVTLILGLVTRLSAAAALVLSVHYMLARGEWFWTPSSNHAAFAFISVALLIGAAGRTLGVDRFLAQRWPRSPFW